MATGNKFKCQDDAEGMNGNVGIVFSEKQKEHKQTKEKETHKMNEN